MLEANYRTACEQCRDAIEFESDWLDAIINCPSCGSIVTLQLPKPQIKSPSVSVPGVAILASLILTCLVIGSQLAWVNATMGIDYAAMTQEATKMTAEFPTH